MTNAINREAEHPGNRNELHAELFGDDEEDEEGGGDEPGYAPGPGGVLGTLVKTTNCKCDKSSE